MTTMTQHPPGTFCWTQLGTTDEEAAKKFYSGLFGWTVDRSTAAGRPIDLFLKGGKAIGAVMPLGADQGEPSWLPFVAVKDVKRATTDVKTQGGKVLMEPMDVLPNGRFAVFQDPTGGTFAVWEAGTKAGSEIVGETGSVVWDELITTDSKKAGTFYGQIFGWKPEPMPMPGGEGGTYTIFKREGAEAGVGGMMTATPQMNLTHPYWMVYFAVDDADQIAKKAEQLGAKVMMPPTDIPTVGRFATIRDPQGAWFSILKPEPRS